MAGKPKTASTTDDVQWLEPEELDAWRTFLDSTRVMFDALEAQLQADAGMPLAYYDILVRLSEAPDRALRMSALADALFSSSSRLSHAVSRLEERGWVRRQSHPSDRRGQFAVLTDEGFEALAAAAPGHVAAVRKFVLDPLTDRQVTQLRKISKAICSAAGRDTPC